jgi:hypothetical protein
MPLLGFRLGRQIRRLNKDAIVIAENGTIDTFGLKRRGIIVIFLHIDTILGLSFACRQARFSIFKLSFDNLMAFFRLDLNRQIRSVDHGAVVIAEDRATDTPGRKRSTVVVIFLRVHAIRGGFYLSAALFLERSQTLRAVCKGHAVFGSTFCFG